MTILNHIDLTDNTASSTDTLANDKIGKTFKILSFLILFNSNINFNRTCKRIG